MNIVYISGAITGLPEEEYKKKFDNAEKKLKQLGYRPINPTKRGIIAGYKWNDYMKDDIVLLCKSDYIYFLDNWEQSKGAKIEKDLAEKLDIPELKIKLIA